MTSFLSLIYNYSWDLIIDWGLLSSSELSTFALRPKITYSRPFYYYAMVVNLVLRCTWLITAFINVNGYPWLTTIGWGTVIGILELYRRWLWALIRIENEQINNFEKYRYIQDIPEINDYVEDKQAEES